MAEQLNMAIAGAGELKLSAFTSGGDTNENKYWSTGRADTDFTQSIADGGSIEVPGTSWDNMGEIQAATQLPGSLKVVFTIPMFTPRSMALALSGAMPARKAVAGGPVVDAEFTFSADWEQRLVGYGEIDMDTTPLVAVDAATGLIDHTDQLVVTTNPGAVFIKPANGATLTDGTELLLDFTELADDGYEIHPNTLPADFGLQQFGWAGISLLAVGRLHTISQ